MPRISKERDYEELREIAGLTDKKNGIYARRRRIWRRRLEAGDSQAELARASGVMRADIIRGVKHGEKPEIP